MNFRPRARIIRIIGDQLISGPEAAVIELVKNSYDADASFVRVKLVPPLSKGEGRIIISDDGHGMSLSDIQEKWMEPATSSKLFNRATKKGRKFLGSKGIGRFASAKLGERMALNSITNVDGVLEEVIIPEIDWSIFNGEAYLSDISIEYLTQIATSPPRTEIEISNFNEDWSSQKIHQLHIELKKLISPINVAADNGFDIYLDLSECTKENAGFDGLDLFSNADSDENFNDDFKVSSFPILTTCDYEVEGIFDSNGDFDGTIKIHRGALGPSSISLKTPLDEDHDHCGEVKVHFFIFDREGQALKNTMRKAGMGEITVKKARQILDEIAGISIYKNDFRIRPYGDLDNDWLTLDTRRVQNPSLRIGHNQVAGFVMVKDNEQSGLEERSSREGFEENASFLRLQHLIVALLTKEIEPRRYSFREKAEIGRRKTANFPELRKLAELSKIRALLSSLPDDERKAGEVIVDRETAELENKIDALEARQVALEAKSSLGLIMGEALHEGAPSARYISTTAKLLSGWQARLCDTGTNGDEIRKQLPKKLRMMEQSGAKIADLFEKLEPLAGGNRGKVKYFNPKQTALDAGSLFESHEITIRVFDSDNVPDIIGYPEDLTAALVNLISNSIYWLEESNTENPEILVSFFREKKGVSIFIEDNGPGIPDEFEDFIFDVSFSLKEGGTGLGLNIAHEAISRSGGTLRYHKTSDRGAKFEILFNDVT